MTPYLENENPQVELAAESLQHGGVVVVPTDTVYGLAVHPEHPEAIDKLYELKGRPRRQHLPIMVADAADIEQLGADVNADARALLRSEHIPGALTIIFGFVDEPKVGWLAGRDEIAVRIPNDEQLLAILRKTGPLLVTSANASGQPTPTEVELILEQLHGAPDFTIEAGSIATVPSTIVNCNVSPPKIEREGVIPAEQIGALLTSKISN